MKKTYKLAIVCLSLLLVGSIFGTTVFASAATANDYVSAYRSDASSARDALTRANELNQKIVEEGIVLLKNNDNALPIATGTRVSVFGKNSVNPFYGGGGSASGADGSGLGGVKYYDLFDSLVNAGFSYNPDLKAFYENNALSGRGRDGGSGTGQVATLTGETPVASYTDSVKASFKNYNDVALVLIARAGGEGADLRTNYTSAVTGRSNYNNNGNAATGDHYLQLDDNEKDMIALAKANFKKVVVVLNMGTSFELGDLQNDDGIDSIVWLGFPGGSGINALGKVLNGEVNPSGRLVDIYARNFKQDPTFANFATNYASAYKTEAGGTTGINFVEYDEGIYIGYRYYETRGYVEGGSWYEDNVVYPFGYGMSYTTFSKKVNFVTKSLTADGSINVDVTVTNTGKAAGKEVVQLYYSAPYTDGEIEKSHIVLGAYEKTDLLQPGMSQKLRLTMKVRDMASYDYNDANANGNTGYELDKGEYTLYVGDNSHVWAQKDAAKHTYKLDKEVLYKTDAVTGTEITNRFDYVSAYFDADSDEVWGGHSKLMSRADFDGTFPIAPTAEEIKISGDEQAKSTYSAATAESDKDQPWYTDKMPTYQTTRKTNISATKLVGLSYEDPRWDKFMDQLTLDDMRNLIVKGFFVTYGIENLDVPVSITPDGPTGFVQGSGSNWVGGTCSYASPIVVASTWNKDLALKMGEAVGDEGIWGGEGENTTKNAWTGQSVTYYGVKGGYNGWYAPGTNTHRSQFSGRNFEYYSEDPLLAGTICANVVKGAQSKGVFVMIKHFALNDQEQNRGNLATWADEQTMREIYLKSFEIAVKDGGATGMMSAFNRIGYNWAGTSYSLLTEVLREEWGFRGLVITDWVNGFMRADLMIRAGNDLWLADGNERTLSTSGSALTPTHVAAMRRAAKSVLYTVVNSNAMNRLGARYTAEHYLGTSYSKDLGTFATGATVSYDAKSTVYKNYKYVLSGAPEGVTIDQLTGKISGKIAADAVSGDYTMTVSLKDDKGYIGQAIVLTLTVDGGLKFVGNTTASVVSGKFARIDVSSALYGKNVTYTVNGTLPQGMTLSADGAIVGVPTTAGTSKFTVVASADGVENLSTEVTVTVGQASKIAYNGSTLAEAKVGSDISVNIATATGADNITYTSNDLPEGLTLVDGKLNGSIATAGEYTFSVTAWAEGCETAVTAEYKIVVKAATPETPHECGHKCAECGKCTSDCADPACADKCQGHKKGGIGVVGIIAITAFALLSVCAIAVVAKRKKKQD